MLFWHFFDFSVEKSLILQVICAKLHCITQVNLKYC